MINPRLGFDEVELSPDECLFEDAPPWFETMLADN
jgi:hypothetical protein